MSIGQIGRISTASFGVRVAVDGAREAPNAPDLIEAVRSGRTRAALAAAVQQSGSVLSSRVPGPGLAAG